MLSKSLLPNKGIILNDLKRYNWIGISYTLLLLFVLPLQIIMNVNKLEERTSYISNPFKPLFYFQGELQEFFILAIPVLTAIFLLRYLQEKRSVDMVHALPLTRVTLCSSHVVAGTLLLLLPVLLTGLLSWVMMVAFNLQAYYALSDIAQWAGTTILISMTLFLFALFVGMVTGTSVAQGILTYITLFLPVGLTVLVLSNVERLLYGFQGQYYMEDGNKLEYFTPIIRLFQLGFDEKMLQSSEIMAYLFSIVLLFGLAIVAYKKRKSEAATQAIAFDFLKPIFKYGVTFCTMLLSGLYFWEIQNDFLWAIFGYIVGSLFGYLLAEIILQKSFKVLASLKNYLIYLLIMAGLLAGFEADVFGYERQLPPVEQVEQLYIGEGGYYTYLRWREYAMEEAATAITEKENIEKVLQLHEAIIQNKTYNENAQSYYSLTFAYQLKNGQTIYRSYALPEASYDQYKKPIFESIEYKHMQFAIFNVDANDVERIVFEPQGISKKAVITDRAHIQEIITILRQETEDESYEQMRDDNMPWARIELWRLVEEASPEMTYRYGVDQSYRSDGKQSYEIMHLNWKKHYKELEQWLQEKGYWQDARILPEDIAYARIVKTEAEKEWVDPKLLPGVEVTKPDELEACLQQLLGRPLYAVSQDENYRIIFYNKNDGEILSGYLKQENVPLLSAW
ncbi:hypothetical protein F9B85_05910 [Heliorestis acidaminivorans]|uniref:DUF6449 domain-containing protein n=1 Tax=Heliorestis acidaminivorans TaxID=553427 RepID=A0A6I0EYF2_9FIRM|nr:DUF6449 domain-containing protein [Heliorestis acidaminivorans]KAB2953441.1 hypothetical protein F9B85_05910 [Heliorestis acidaminivorans]